jgi:ABC-type phosphate/phosphonate transport system substrate-binding protein
VIEHPSPRPLEELWARTDQGAVFMCGLPFSTARPQPALIAAPVPAPPEFGNEPRYWSDFVVRADSPFQSVADTFGRRIAFTVPNSQSGCVAAMTHFMSMAGAGLADRGAPLFGEIVAPTLSPLGALNAVVTGAAEIAPLDAYALRLLQKFRPDLASQVRMVGKTAATPIPPLVASHSGLGALRDAFLRAGDDPAQRALMDDLLLQRFTQPPAGAYDDTRTAFEAARAHWRTHRLAAVTHPAFASNFR